MKTTSVSNPESATKVMHISEINLTYKEGRPMFWIDKEGNIVRERNGSRPVMLHKDTIPKLINRNYYKLIGFLTTNSNWKGAWFEVTEIITGGPVKETTVHASFTYSGTGPIFKLRKGVIVGLDEKGLVVFPSKNLLGRLEFGKEYESIGLVKVFPEKKAGTYHVSSLKKMDRVNGLGEEDQLAAEKAIEEIEGATGGGHQEATGAMIPIDDWEKFKEKILELIPT